MAKKSDSKESEKETISSSPDAGCDRISSLVYSSADILEYGGRKYLKMFRLMGRPNGPSAPADKKRCQLWACIEFSGMFPARTVVVPEFSP